MPADPAPPIFDPGFLVGTFGDDPGFLRDVVGGYLEGFPRDASALRAALQAGDWAQVELHAHAIKGAAANLGAGRLRHAAADLERCGVAQEGARCRALLEALLTELAALEAELHARHPDLLPAHD